MNLRLRIKRWVPPALLEVRRRHIGNALHFVDGPGDWAQALRQSSGYSMESIVERVAAATREVIAGRALYERDSVLFQEPDYPFPIVAQLLRAALANGGRLNVIDFGGSLGSTYRQCRPMLDGVDEVSWCVVEQPVFVSLGQREFTTEELHFAASLQDLRQGPVPALILLSSVLQYLEHPEATLRELLSLGANHLVLDRTSMSTVLADPRLCIQQTPKRIYDASYPCWILSRSSLLATLQGAGWHVRAEFENREGHFATQTGLEFEFRGLIAERSQVSS